MNPTLFSVIVLAVPTAALFALIYLWLTRKRPRVGSAEGWRAACGQEQHRADQWRHLFERQRHIEDLSPAAARQEQFDIDRRARVLGFQVPPTRRSEP